MLNANRLGCSDFLLYFTLVMNYFFYINYILYVVHFNMYILYSSGNRQQSAPDTFWYQGHVDMAILSEIRQGNTRRRKPQGQPRAGIAATATSANQTMRGNEQQLARFHGGAVEKILACSRLSACARVIPTSPRVRWPSSHAVVITVTKVTRSPRVCQTGGDHREWWGDLETWTHGEQICALYEMSLEI